MVQVTSSAWIDEHLETFVRPHLRSIPDIDMKRDALKPWNPRLIVALHAVWKQTKRLAEGRVILLPGRDVWLFEVLARMEGWPTIFRQVISSSVARSGLLKEDFSKCHCLDTGFSGSVPKNLKVEHWHLVHWAGYPINGRPGTNPLAARVKDKHRVAYFKGAWQRIEHQVFPYVQSGVQNPVTNIYTGGSPICSLASVLEGSPKYWERADVEYDPPQTYTKAVKIKDQPLFQDMEVFRSAAMLTRLIAESCLIKRS